MYLFIYISMYVIVQISLIIIKFLQIPKIYICIYYIYKKFIIYIYNKFKILNQINILF